MIAGALWVGLVLAAAGDPATAPAPSLAPVPVSSAVAVTRPPADDAILDEASTRIRSELAASGIESILVDCEKDAPAGSPGCAAVTASATISLAREDGVAEIDVGVTLPDGLEMRRHVRVLPRDGGDDPSVLAVRAVEVLRDLRLNARPRAPAGPQGPARDDEEPKIPLPPPPPPRWRISSGAAVLAAPAFQGQGIGPALGVALGAGAVLDSHFAVFVALAGPFNSSFGAVNARSSALVQAIATLELRYRFTLGPLQPFGALLSGVNYLKETVTGGSSGTAVTATWVPAFGAGGGLSLELWERFTASVEADGFVTAPDVLVEVQSQIVGRTGAPSLLVQANVGLQLP
ncbi:MAG TPA: hypothetical protein VH853_10945 [Polyangia bacterium]|nr:hypothetical protein [Polyangia bacterium]